MLLDQQDWDDPFTPVYLSYDGIYAVGNPGDPTDEDLPLEPYYWEAIDENINAIPNMINLDFSPDTTVQEVSDLIYSNGLTLCTSWWEPVPAEPDRSVTWVLAKINPESPGYGDLDGALTFYGGINVVEYASPDWIAFRIHQYAEPLDSGFPYNDGIEINSWIPGHELKIGWQDYLKGQDEWNTGEYLDVVSGWNAGGTKGELVSEPSRRVGVAVMGTGVDWRHDDLFDQLYTHPVTGQRMGGRVLYADDGYKSGPIREITQDRPLWDESLDEECLGLPRRIHPHETLVAGVIAAEECAGPGNFSGVVGCAPNAQIFPVYIKHENWGGKKDGPHWLYAYSVFMNSYRLMRYQMSVDFGYDNLKVINMSGGRPHSSTVRSIMKPKFESVMHHNNQLIVACAGNDGEQVREVPAAFSNVLGVTGAWKCNHYPTGSLDDVGHFASNYIEDWGGALDRSTYGASGYYTLRPPVKKIVKGEEFLVYWSEEMGFGPYSYVGVEYMDKWYDIVSTDIIGANVDYYDEVWYGEHTADEGSDFGHVAGTSFATPQVAALAALIWAKHGLGTHRDTVRDIIQNNLKEESLPILDFDEQVLSGQMPGVIDFEAALSE